MVSQLLTMPIIGLLLLLLGAFALLFYHLYQWRRDRKLAEHVRVERQLTPSLNHTPKVSALVAAWNEGESIGAHIRSFLALTYPNIELILCAGGTDDTLERARRYASERVTVLEQRRGEGKQKALARCLERATGEIIYLTDADSLFINEELIRLLAPLIEEGEQVATGSLRPLDQQANRLLPAYIWVSDVVVSAHSPTYSRGIRGCNVAITRQAIERIGGINFDAPTGTDYQLAQRILAAGVSIRYVGASVVPTEYPETLRSYRHKQSRWLRNLLIYGRRYGADSDVRVTLQTIATGTAMVLAPLAALVFGSVVLVPWLLLVAHASLSKARYALFAAHVYQRVVPARFFAFLLPLRLLDFAIWALPLLDLLNAKRRHQW